jgi:hypothetical protein
MTVPPKPPADFGSGLYLHPQLEKLRQQMQDFIDATGGAPAPRQDDGSKKPPKPPAPSA